MIRVLRRTFVLAFVCGFFTACFSVSASDAQKPRLSMFIGVDISGSFMKGKYYDDSLDFLAHYLYAHLNGLGGLEVPKVVFVGSLGGSKTNEPKTFYPIQTFENKSIAEIRAKLREIFPKKENPYTDFNAFFEQVANTVKNRKLILRPMSLVLISDGIPDFPRGKKETHNIKDIQVQPLEQLSRNITVRLLYTDPVHGGHWQSMIRRQRVKVWTQDAEVMVQWRDPKIMIPGKPIEQQSRLFNWVKDNVDFGVRARRVD